MDSTPVASGGTVPALDVAVYLRCRIRDLPASLGDYRLGIVVLLDARNAGPAVSLLLQRGHLYDHRVWRPGSARTMAAGRRRRSANRDSDVRLVQRVLFRPGRPHVRSTSRSGA